MRASIPVTSALALLAGCSQIDKGLHEIGLGPDPDAPPDTCSIQKAGRVIDLPASDAVLADIRTRVGERHLRVIHPGDAVTMDFRPDRLNVEIGAGGRIERLRCG